MNELINELDLLLKKYNIDIYDAMKIYEKNQIKAIKRVQCYEDTENVWQYYNDYSNACGCGSNCFHLEYDRNVDKIYGVCNCCNKNIYVINEEYKETKLKQGKWIDKDFKFIRDKFPVCSKCGD